MLNITRRLLVALVAPALIIGLFHPMLHAITVQENLSPSAVTIPRSPEVLSQRAQAFLSDRNPDTAKVWVFFTDKGVTGANSFEKKAGSVALETRALVRRRKVHLDKVVFADLPVNTGYVDQIVARGATLRQKSRWLNAASFDVDPKLLESIASLGFVAKIQPIAEYKREPVTFGEKNLEWPEKAPAADVLNYGNSYTQLNQIDVPELHNRGLNGAGVTLAIFDTGFRKSHEAFAQHYLDGRVLGEHDFVFGDSNTANEAGDDPSQWDHGTLIWSVVGGQKDGRIYGPAYDANFLLAKTEDVRSETQVEEDNWVAAMEWADSAGADVITSSLAYSDWYVPSQFDGTQAVTTIAANTAVSLGIVVCNAMGNEGPSAMTLDAPADAFDILAVGAVNSGGTIASFSSRGPTADGRIKPEVCAMGVSTYAASSSGDANYTTASGTSLSTPLVAGVACLMVEAHPTFTPQLIRRSMIETASMADSPNNDYGWGIVDAVKAAEWGARMGADVTVGEAPLAVQFADSSDLTASAWVWSFGDGDSSLVQNPAHVFQDPGSYDVSMRITTTYGDITDLNEHYVLATADTLRFGPDSNFAGQDIIVSVKLKNTQPLTTIYLPVQYTDGPDVHWTGAQRGDRISYFEDFETVAFDPVNHRFTLKATANVGGGSPPLPPGDGEIVKLIFSSSDTALGGETAGVDSTVQSNYTVKLLTDFASYGPQVYGGEARVITVQRGDVNFDHELNIADLTYLVEYEFMGGAPPVSFASADVDADRSVTIADITYLATYEFKHGPEPPPLQ